MMTNHFPILSSFLNGAVTLAALAIVLFFLQFYKKTKDRLFGFFAGAFALIGVEHAAVNFVGEQLESSVYLIRLAAFVLIVIGILDKNRKGQ